MRRRQHRDGSADRRDDAKRRQVEMVLDRFFRPRAWAARSAWNVGLQSARPVRVERHEIAVNSQRALRIAFASDFHAGATTDTRVLATACDALAAIEPDILLLGGDFVSVRANDIHDLAVLLGRIRAPLGKFGVFGNHDLRANHGVIRDALDAGDVRVLVNEVAQLDGISIIGLDDPIIGKPDASIIDGVTGTRVVLMHAPDGLLAIGDRHFDLALCGHTHGGQVVMPGGIIPYLPHGALSREFPVGTYALGERTLIVTRGVGCSTVPVRMFCSAEVHSITVG